MGWVNLEVGMVWVGWKFTTFGVLGWAVGLDLVRHVPCTSASSAQSKCDFSSLGYTTANTRSRLSANKVEFIEVIRCGLRSGLL